jgi:hypothetical protein
MLELEAVVPGGEEEANFGLVELDVDLGSRLPSLVHAPHLARQQPVVGQVPRVAHRKVRRPAVVDHEAVLLHIVHIHVGVRQG